MRLKKGMEWIGIDALVQRNEREIGYAYTPGNLKCVHNRTIVLCSVRGRMSVELFSLSYWAPHRGAMYPPHLDTFDPYGVVVRRKTVFYTHSTPTGSLQREGEHSTHN